MPGPICGRSPALSSPSSIPQGYHVSKRRRPAVVGRHLPAGQLPGPRRLGVEPACQGRLRNVRPLREAIHGQGQEVQDEDDDQEEDAGPGHTHTHTHTHVCHTHAHTYTHTTHLGLGPGLLDQPVARRVEAPRLGLGLRPAQEE